MDTDEFECFQTWLGHARAAEASSLDLESDLPSNIDVLEQYSFAMLYNYHVAALIRMIKQYTSRSELLSREDHSLSCSRTDCTRPHISLLSDGRLALFSPAMLENCEMFYTQFGSTAESVSSIQIQPSTLDIINVTEEIWQFIQITGNMLSQPPAAVILDISAKDDVLRLRLEGQNRTAMLVVIRPSDSAQTMQVYLAS